MERQNIRHPETETGDIDQEPLDADTDDTLDEDEAEDSDALDLD